MLTAARARLHRSLVQFRESRQLPPVLVLLLAVMVALFVWGGRSALAADGPLKAGRSDPHWVATYFNNTNLEGDPVLTRNESTLGGRWGFGSPHDNVQSDFFSARWTRYVNLTAGVWRFTAVTDDGMRIWIDDRLILDEWQVQAERTFVVDQSLAAGDHLIRVEYFENNGEAAAQLRWAKASNAPATPVPSSTVVPSSGVWRAEYFNNRTLSGDPALVRNETLLNLNWGTGSPDTNVIQVDDFSARFTNTLTLPAGTWRFTVGSDDGVRLWVNDALVIDQWRVQAFNTYAADVWVGGGSVPVRLEYFEESEKARVFLQWTPAAGVLPTPSSSVATATPTTSDEDSHWRGQYYTNVDFDGSPDFVRYDSDIDFDWGYGGPRSDFPVDWFGVRWTRTMWFPEGTTRFTAEVDDGVRIFVDGDLVLEKWFAQERTRYSVNVSLSRGQHTVVVEYMERTLLASIALNMSTPQDTREPVGNLITCAPPQPENYAWIKLYRLDGNNNWYSIGRGIGSIESSGFLKIDGLPVDQNRFGAEGEPYRVEMWEDGKVTLSTGNFQAGEPEFRVRAFVDNYTPWGCSR